MTKTRVLPPRFMVQSEPLIDCPWEGLRAPILPPWSCVVKPFASVGERHAETMMNVPRVSLPLPLMSNRSPDAAPAVVARTTGQGGGPEGRRPVENRKVTRLRTLRLIAGRLRNRVLTNEVVYRIALAYA